MTPSFTRSENVSLSPLYPHEPSFSAIFSATKLPFLPQLLAIAMAGAKQASLMICTPMASSPVHLRRSSALDARMRATPPPTTIPCAIAALVAHKASSILAFFSLASASVAAPTLITPMPPLSLASLCSSFSFS